MEKSIISFKAPKPIKDRLLETAHERKMSGKNNGTLTALVIELIEKGFETLEKAQKNVSQSKEKTE